MKIELNAKIMRTTSKSTSIHSLSEELLVHILSFLRAKEFGFVGMVDKTVFHLCRLALAISTVVGSCPVIPLTSPLRQQQSLSCVLFTPSSLFVFEVTNLLAALSMPAPISLEQAFWISKAWCNSARRYFETIQIPVLCNTSSSSLVPLKFKSSGQKKKVSLCPNKKDYLHPSMDINKDIVCIHGNLSLSNNRSSKRRTIDKRAWSILRRYFREGRQFKCSESMECISCTRDIEQNRAKSQMTKEIIVSTRRELFLPSLLGPLAIRKTGIPDMSKLSLLPHNNDTFENDQKHTCFPLISGMYNLIPRCWLQLYRKFLKDPMVAALPPVDCTNLLCYSHGLLVIPPHVTDFILGVKRNLLGNLFDYHGEVVEIVTAEEWDEINRLCQGGTDFHVRFCLDGETIFWNVDICHACDPYNYYTSSAVRNRVAVL